MTKPFFSDKVEVFFLLISPFFDFVSGVIKSVLMDFMAKGASTDASVRMVQSEFQTCLTNLTNIQQKWKEEKIFAATPNTILVLFPKRHFLLL